MKYITETALRHELHAIEPESYVVPRGQKLTPAAREYLQTRKIKIVPEAVSYTHLDVYKRQPQAERALPSRHRQSGRAL